MDLGAISLAIIGAMVVLLLLGVPFAFVTGVIGVVLCLTQFGPDALSLLGSRAYSFLDSYTLVSVPLFILMASLLERSRVTQELYQAIAVWAGPRPGGVGVVTVGVSIIIGAAIGVSGGEMVLLGLVALPQLLRLGYDRRLACGLVCAGGALGTLIPPSLVLVFYGLTANVSVADLFTASAMPGLMLAAIYAGYVWVRCQLNPALGPPPPAEELQRTLGQKIAMLKGIALPVLVAFSVLGSIYLGLASVTESAALGVGGTLIAIALRGELTLKLVHDALRQTMSACGAVLWLVLGTNALIGVYNVMGGIDYATGLLQNLPFGRWGVLFLMLGVWIALGFFIDWIGILLLTAPIFVPTANALGFDPIWFGTLFNFCMMIGYLTPPFAPAAFFLKGVAPPEITLETIYGSLWPFIGLQMIGLVLVLIFPEIATWLPSVLGD
jgi:tripartite ATP-independent transporter DctM subunit